MSFMQVLKSEGVPVRSTTFNDKDDESFIARIQHLLEMPDKPNNMGRLDPRIIFRAECKGLISDIRNVQWQRNKIDNTNKPKLEISNRDYLACLKYALATNISFNKERQQAFYHTQGFYGFGARQFVPRGYTRG